MDYKKTIELCLFWWIYLIAEMLVKRGLLWLLFCSVAFYGINGDDLSAEEMEEEIFGRVEEKVLSRKRRYLTFPEGSSLQVGKQ